MERAVAGRHPARRARARPADVDRARTAGALRGRRRRAARRDHQPGRPLTERMILEGLETVSPELAEQVRAQMFIFEDITTLDDTAIQLVLRNVESNDLALALKGTSAAVREKIMKNLSSRAAENLGEEIELLGPKPALRGRGGAGQGGHRDPRPGAGRQDRDHAGRRRCLRRLSCATAVRAVRLRFDRPLAGPQAAGSGRAGATRRSTPQSPRSSRAAPCRAWPRATPRAGPQAGQARPSARRREVADARRGGWRRTAAHRRARRGLLAALAEAAAPRRPRRAEWDELADVLADGALSIARAALARELASVDDDLELRGSGRPLRSLAGDGRVVRAARTRPTPRPRRGSGCPRAPSSWPTHGRAGHGRRPRRDAAAAARRTRRGGGRRGGAAVMTRRSSPSCATGSPTRPRARHARRGRHRHRRRRPRRPGPGHPRRRRRAASPCAPPPGRCPRRSSPCTATPRATAATCMPLGATTGIATGDEVRARAQRAAGARRPGLLGRVVDALGRPLDGARPAARRRARAARRRRAQPAAPPPRRHGCCPPASARSTRSSRSARASASGSWRAPASASRRCSGWRSRGTAAPVRVVALVGERGREVREFLEDTLDAGEPRAHRRRRRDRRRRRRCCG